MRTRYDVYMDNMPLSAVTGSNSNAEAARLMEASTVSRNSFLFSSLRPSFSRL